MVTTMNVDGSKVSFLNASRSLGANTDMHTVRALHTRTTQTYGSLEGIAAEIVAEFHAEVAAMNAVDAYGRSGIGVRAQFFKEQHAARLQHLLDTATVSDLYDVVNWQDDQLHSSDDLETQIFHARSRGAFERQILARIDGETESKQLAKCAAGSDQYAASLERRRSKTPSASTAKPKVGARLAIRGFVEEIDAFEAQCQEVDRTDTGEVWALLEGLRSMARTFG